MYAKSLSSPILFFLLFFTSLLNGQNQWWESLNEAPDLLLRNQEINIPTQQARYIKVDFAQLQSRLAQAERAGEAYIPFEIPVLGEATEVFMIKEQSIMAPALQQKYPTIRTYSGYAIKNPALKIRISRAPNEWHAMISDQTQSIYIDPYSRPSGNYYQIYQKEDCLEKQVFLCGFRNHQTHQEPRKVEPRNQKLFLEDVVRVYRLAVSTSYEYTEYFGGTKSGAMAGIVNTINRVNMVYERDLAIRLELIPNNDTLIVTDPNEEAFTRRGFEGDDNQDFTDDRIGNENYDIGHVFGIGSGGLAILGSVCDDSSKADTYTGLNRPQGDPFDIDFVAHEIGHQFGANHSFNGVAGSCLGNGFFPTSFEPGSGTTIMAYAGICGSDNVAPNSSDYFHAGSIDEIFVFTENGLGRTCPTLDSTGNSRPEIEILDNDGKYIPVLTPFELEGQAIDAEGDALTYCWEQIDRGQSAPLGEYGGGNAALFRSYPPVSNGKRIFPRLNDLLNNRFRPFELLPNRDRELNFQLTVRDNNPDGGALSWEQVQYFVDGSTGPFRMNNPPSLQSGAYQLLSWDVAGTNLPPVSTDSVTISLSTEGGGSFDRVLGNFPNTGSAIVFIPEDINTIIGRVKIKALDNIYFDVNDRNISIQPSSISGAALDILTEAVDYRFCSEDSIRIPVFINAVGFNSNSELRLGVSSEGFQPVLSVREDLPNAFELLLLNGLDLPGGNYRIELIAERDDTQDTLSLDIQLLAIDTDLSVDLLGPTDAQENSSLQPTFNWLGKELIDNYQLEIASDPMFSNLVYQSDLLVDTILQLPITLDPESLYYWRVVSNNLTCGVSSTSAVNTFQTEGIICEIFTPEDLPIAFNALPFIQSFIEVDREMIIRDVNILDIQGTYPSPNSGLSFRLRSPEGPIIEIASRQENCTLGDEFSFSVDGEVNTSFIPCPNDREFTIRSAQDLSPFYGQRANGRWSLSIFDDGEEGRLNNWRLEICYGAAAVTSTRDEIITDGTLRVYPNPTKTMINFDLKDKDIQQIQIFDLMGRNVFTNNGVNQTVLVLPLNNWDAGVYFYKVMDKEGSIYSGKILKQ